MHIQSKLYVQCNLNIMWCDMLYQHMIMSFKMATFYFIAIELKNV